jgi:hypothetical protein
MAFHLERRHSGALLDVKRKKTIEGGHFKADCIEEDIKLGATKTRLFYGAVQNELKYETVKMNQILNQKKKMQRMKKLSEDKIEELKDSGYNVVDDLTHQIDVLQNWYSRNGQPCTSKTSPNSSKALESSRSPSLKKSPIQRLKKSPIQAAGKKMLQSRTTPPTLNLDFIHKYQSVAKTSSNTTIYNENQTSKVGTQKIVQRLASPQNYTGIYRRHANANTSPMHSPQISLSPTNNNSRTSFSLSHQDIRDERTARESFQRSLRKDLYNMNDR